MRVLVLHPGALGDVILSLPALSELRKRFPQAHITAAGNLDYLVIARSNADEIISLSTVPLHRLFGSAPLPPEDIAFWQAYDLIVSWTGAGSEEFTRNLRTANGGARISSWRPTPGDDRHVSKIFQDSLGFVDSDTGDNRPVGLSLDETDRHAGELWLRRHAWIPGKPLVALHPGAGSPKKRWSLTRFQALARVIVENSDAGLVVLEGPAEPGFARDVQGPLPSDRCYVAEALPLGQLAGVLSFCDAFIGNDSGVAHLAAGLNIPSVILFGPTKPEYWAPMGERVVILRDIRGCDACIGDGDSRHCCLDNISVAEVLSTVRLSIAIRPRLVRASGRSPVQLGRGR